MPQHPDAQIHPHATGAAAKTAAEHDKLVDGAVKFYCGWFCECCLPEWSVAARLTLLNDSRSLCAAHSKFRVVPSSCARPDVSILSCLQWISLEEKGVPYQLIEINPYHKDPEFLRINPLGLVPALESEGVNLYESTILNEFLEEKFPDKKPLYPTKFEDKAIARIRIDFISKKVLPAFMRTIQAQDSKAQTESRAELVQALKQFASYIDPSKGPFVGGRELGAVDISLAPWGVRQWGKSDRARPEFLTLSVLNSFATNRCCGSH